MVCCVELPPTAWEARGARLCKCRRPPAAYHLAHRRRRLDHCSPSQGQHGGLYDHCRGFLWRAPGPCGVL